MRVVIQRVKNAKVIVDDETVGEIGHGILLLLGIKKGDTEEDVVYLVGKILNLRIFNDESGKMNLSLTDIEGEMLIVSQFTLYADTSKGRRPSYVDAAGPDEAKNLYALFIDRVRQKGIKVETGVFGASMDVELTNRGPVTLIIDTDSRGI